MKILCFIDSLNSGGGQRQMVNLAIGFKERGHEVIMLNYHALNFFKSQLDSHNIPVKTVSQPNYLKRLFRIRSIIRSEKPDAVLSFLSAANFMATFSGLPNRNWTLVVGERSANPNIVKSLKQRFYRFFHIFPDYIVANSYANLELIKKANPFLKGNKLKVIYNIININHTSKVIRINSDKTHIVIAARYVHIKNLGGLIKAVAGLPQIYKEKLHIDWYGNIENNSYYDDSKLSIQEYNLQNVIKLHNRTHEVYNKYIEADFVGLFSKYEGFPNTICEALALQKPVICTNVSDIPLFLKEGENGFFCEYNQTESIKQALIRAIDSSEEERLKMGVNNRKIVESKFKREDIIDQYIELFKKS